MSKRFQKRLGNVHSSTLEEFQKILSFENIGIFDVIEHVQNDDEFLEVLFSRLRSEGMLFMTVPAYNFLWSSEDEHVYHFRRYTAEELIKLAEKAGFKCVDSSYFFPALIPIIFVLRTLPSMLGLNKESVSKKHHQQNIIQKCLEKFRTLEVFLHKMSFRLPIGASIIQAFKK